MAARRNSLQTPVWPFVILRVGLGYWFLKLGAAKFPVMLEPGKLAAQLTGMTNNMPAGWYPWYRSFLVHALIPYADILAYFVVLGEIAVGSALIIGFLTRPALAAAMIMNLNYHLASGYRPGAAGFANLIFFYAELALIFTPVGRVLGVDYFLHKKIPRLGSFS